MHFAVEKPVEIPQVYFLDKVYMPVVMVSGTMAQKLSMPVVGVWCSWPDSAENCGCAAVAVLRSRRFPCRAEETDPHGLACSEDHRDSAVAVHCLVVDSPVVQVVLDISS